MVATSKAATRTFPGDRTLLLTRRFEAPRELVFKVWTSAEHIVHWWGPKDFSVSFSAMDARPGGKYRACLRSSEGADYWMQGLFHEVLAPARLVFSWAWEDDDGKPGHETVVTLEFAETDGATVMTFRQEVFESVESCDSHHGGWTECFDRLEEYLSQTVHGDKDGETEIQQGID